MKVVINQCFGGFSLSEEAALLYASKKNLGDDDMIDVIYNVDRADPILLEVIGEIGIDAAAGRYAELKIIEIPDDIEWDIEDYDGREWVAEKHRTWS